MMAPCPVGGWGFYCFFAISPSSITIPISPVESTLSNPFLILFKFLTYEKVMRSLALCTFHWRPVRMFCHLFFRWHTPICRCSRWRCFLQPFFCLFVCPIAAYYPAKQFSSNYFTFHVQYSPFNRITPSMQ